MSIFTKKDIYKGGNPVEQLTKDLQKLLEVEKQIIKANKTLATSLTKVKKSSDGIEARKLVQATDQLRKSNRELTNVQKERIRVKKQLEITMAKAITSNEKQNQVLAKGKVRLQENNKLLKQQAREAIGLVGAFEKLTKETNEAQKKFKNLAAQFGANSKQAKAAKKQFETLDDKLNKVNKAARDGRRDVGRYGLALKGVGSNLIGALGLTGLMTGLVGIFRRGAKVFKTFEKSSSKLAAILGTTKDGVKNLTEQAKELGSTTAFTASEVIALQTELAKLGFTTEQIEASTAAILSLAAATGSELAESAELAGATLRIFNLDASQMSRVTDVLAKSTTISSLSMEKLATIMPTVGKTAQLAGVSLERTAALAGTLTDRGLDASTAATSLRNIFLELSKKGITWNEAMEKINSSTDKNKASMDLFGKRAAAAGSILAETSGSTDELTISLENATGAAKEMSDVMLNNLSGDMTIAQSAWEGLILSIEDGEGVISESTRKIVKWFTGVFEALKKVNEGESLYTQKLKKDSDLVGQVSKRWEEYQRQIWQANNAEEEASIIRSKTIKLNRKLIGLNFTLNKGVENGSELSTRRRAELELEVDFYEQLKVKLQNYNKKVGESNEVVDENTEEEDSNNIVRERKIDLLRDEERLIDEIFVAEQESFGKRKSSLIALESFKLQKQIEGVNNLLASEEFKNQRIEQLRKESLGRINEIEKQFETPELITGARVEEFNPSKESQKTTDELAKQQAEADAIELQRFNDLQNAKFNVKREAEKQFVGFSKNLAQNLSDEQLARQLDDIEAEKIALENKLNKGLISQKEFNDGISELNKKQRKAEAKAEKRSALYQIAINTAVGIVKAFGNPIKIAEVFGIGLIQAAAVAATPIPKLEKGEINIQGKRHSEGGIVREFEGGESVITRQGTSNAPEILDMINKGVVRDSDFKGMTSNQTDGLIATLMMQGNKQNDQIIQLLTNGGYTFENGGFIYEKMADGSLRKTVKNG